MLFRSRMADANEEEPGIPMGYTMRTTTRPDNPGRCARIMTPWTHSMGVRPLRRYALRPSTVELTGVAAPVPPPHPRGDRAVSEINWNAELRKIDREYSGLPPEPSPASVKANAEISPFATRGRKRFFCSSVPKRMSG